MPEENNQQTENEEDGTPDLVKTTKAPKGKVFLSAQALKSIILYAKRYANDNIPEYEWKEVYGFLIGRVQNDDVRVDSAVAMTSGEATEVSFDASHYSKAWQLDNEIAERSDNSFVCGWWHTHPFRSNPNSVFLSSIDVMNHLGFQNPNPLAIALVHDPSKIKSKEIQFGIKIFRLTRTDFTEMDLDRYALDLNPEGNTKSNQDELVYYEVPFEVVGITPEFFTESLVDVFEKTAKGDPVEKAYMEGDVKEEPGVMSINAPPQDLSDLQNLMDEPVLSGTPISWSDEPDDDSIEIPSGPVTMDERLPSVMENQASIHVLPEEEFEQADSHAHTEEADRIYKNALVEKKNKRYEAALGNLKDAYRVYSKLEAPTLQSHIKNETMECYYWNGNYQDALIESDKLLKLGENAGDFYFMGNAQEFRGRAFLQLGNKNNARTALQEAKIHFSSGNYFAKAAAVTELIARAFFTQGDFEYVGMFLIRALQLYQDAINKPTQREPAWANSQYISSHGRELETTLKQVLGKMEEEPLKKRIMGDIKKLRSWN